MAKHKIYEKYVSENNANPTSFQDRDPCSFSNIFQSSEATETTAPAQSSSPLAPPVTESPLLSPSSSEKTYGNRGVQTESNETLLNPELEINTHFCNSVNLSTNSKIASSIDSPLESYENTKKRKKCCKCDRLINLETFEQHQHRCQALPCQYCGKKYQTPTVLKRHEEKSKCKETTAQKNFKLNAVSETKRQALNNLNTLPKRRCVENSNQNKESPCVRETISGTKAFCNGCHKYQKKKSFCKHRSTCEGIECICLKKTQSTQETKNEKESLPEINSRKNISENNISSATTCHGSGTQNSTPDPPFEKVDRQNLGPRSVLSSTEDKNSTDKESQNVSALRIRSEERITQESFIRRCCKCDKYYNIETIIRHEQTCKGSLCHFCNQKFACNSSLNYHQKNNCKYKPNFADAKTGCSSQTTLKKKRRIKRYYEEKKKTRAKKKTVGNGEVPTKNFQIAARTRKSEEEMEIEEDNQLQTEKINSGNESSTSQECPQKNSTAISSGNNHEGIYNKNGLSLTTNQVTTLITDQKYSEPSNSVIPSKVITSEKVPGIMPRETNLIQVSPVNQTLNNVVHHNQEEVVAHPSQSKQHISWKQLESPTRKKTVGNGEVPTKNFQTAARTRKSEEEMEIEEDNQLQTEKINSGNESSTSQECPQKNSTAISSGNNHEGIYNKNGLSLTTNQVTTLITDQKYSEPSKSVIPSKVITSEKVPGIMPLEIEPTNLIQVSPVNQTLNNVVHHNREEVDAPSSQSEQHISRNQPKSPIPQVVSNLEVHNGENESSENPPKNNRVASSFSAENILPHNQLNHVSATNPQVTFPISQNKRGKEYQSGSLLSGEVENKRLELFIKAAEAVQHLPTDTQADILKNLLKKS